MSIETDGVRLVLENVEPNPSSNSGVLAKGNTWQVLCLLGGG